MNKFKEIKNSKYILETNIDYDVSFTDIHWKTQESTETSILFFKITENSQKYFHDLKYSIIVLNKKLEYKIENAIYIDEKNWYLFQAQILDLLFPVPDRKYLGVTGTNGKTTVTHLASQVLNTKEIPNLLIGTLGIWLNGKVIYDFQLTSPSLIDLRKIIYRHRDEYKVLVMELSSHGLDQGRFISINFDSIVWTNISHDHLDYHGTFANYFDAKKKCFELLKPNAKVIILENEKSLLELEHDNLKRVPCTESKNEFFNIGFNKKNLSLLKSMLSEINIENIDDLKILPVPGRFNVFDVKTNKVIIDFAHTPAALENIISSVKEVYPNKEIITLFGCGGNRDQSKRKIMGEIASNFSNFVIITSDNPRFENPNEILEQIRLGLVNSNYHVELDRKLAIKYALKKFKNAVIILAGKGHEDYIDINGSKEFYSDIEEVKNYI